jgi:hypothetical protein
MEDQPAPLGTKSQHPHQSDEIRSQSAVLGADSSSSSSTSNHHDSSDQRLTVASCKACRAEFAEFYNGWQQITVNNNCPSIGSKGASY